MVSVPWLAISSLVVIVPADHVVVPPWSNTLRPVNVVSASMVASPSVWTEGVDAPEPAN